MVILQYDRQITMDNLNGRVTVKVHATDSQL